MRRWSPWHLALASALAASGCVSSGPAQPPAVEAEREPARLVGVTDRAGIEAVRPEWVEETAAANPDPVAANGLLAVEPAEVTIYLGTWCSDSRRELARFWRALDDLPYAPPIEITYVAVDRAKAEPGERIAGVDLRYVPTFVVARGGRELGRVIEEAPAGIESDLLDLLTGRAGGWISARDDLGEGPPAGTGGGG